MIPERIHIGYVNEKHFRRARIDISELLSNAPSTATMVPSVLHKRHGDTGPYPVASCTLEGGTTLVWEFDATDTAVQGYGEARVQLTSQDGTILGLSKPISTVVGRGTGSVGTVPPAGADWASNAMAAATSASSSATAAAASATATKAYADQVAAVVAAYEAGELNGSDASVTSANIATALGYTPANAASVISGVKVKGQPLAKDSNGLVTMPLAGTNDPGLAVHVYGRGLSVANGAFSVKEATSSEIAGRSTPFAPITPNTLNIAVQAALTDSNAMQLNAQQKAAAQSTLGVTALNSSTIASALGYTPANSGSVVTGVKANNLSITKDANGVVNIPPASYAPGVVHFGGADETGLAFTNGSPYINAATTADITTGTSTKKPITPSTLDHAVKTALTSVTHMPYTDAEKAAAQARLGLSIDTTLTVDGAAANAKTVGDALEDVVQKVTFSQYVPQTSGTSGQVLTRTSDGATWQDAQGGDTTALERRVHLLEEAAMGHLYTQETDTTAAYSKTVPSGVLGNAILTAIGGHTEVVDGSLLSAEVVSVRSDGANLLDASSLIGQTVQGTWYYLPVSVQAGTYAVNVHYVDGTTSHAWNAFNAMDSSRAKINTVNTAYPQASRGMTISADDAPNVVYVGIYFNNDAGKTFAGVSMVRGTVVPTTYTPYRAPITHAIPSAVRTAYPLRSAGSVHDSYEYDGEKWWHVKRVGSVDMGSMDWLLNSSLGGSPAFYAHPSDIAVAVANSSIGSLLAVGFTTVSADNLYSNADGDHIISVNGGGYVQTRCPNYATVAEFKTALNGVMLQCAIDTPIRTDITSLMAWDAELSVEGGGSITLVQDGTQMAVPSTVEYLVKTT